MLSKMQKPKTKQELIKALQSPLVKSFEVYEGADLNKLPAKSELGRKAVAVIVLL